MEWITDFIVFMAKAFGFVFGLWIFLICSTVILNKVIGSLRQERQDKVLTWMDKVVREIKKFEAAFWENRYLLFWIWFIVAVSLQLYV